MMLLMLLLLLLLLHKAKARVELLLHKAARLARVPQRLRQGLRVQPALQRQVLVVLVMQLLT